MVRLRYTSRRLAGDVGRTAFVSVVEGGIVRQSYVRNEYGVFGQCLDVRGIGKPSGVRVRMCHRSGWTAIRTVARFLQRRVF